MTLPTHQTVRLRRGHHGSPEEGACVMELASMLAGERFRDNPRCVCPIVAAFLRAYNDAIDDRRRQDLYPFAAAAVGTAGDPVATRKRARECAAWFSRGVPAERRTRFWILDRAFVRLRRGRISYATRVYARRTTNESHAEALRFIERLITLRPMTADLGTASATGEDPGAKRSLVGRHGA